MLDKEAGTASPVEPPYPHVTMVPSDLSAMKEVTSEATSTTPERSLGTGAKKAVCPHSVTCPPLTATAASGAASTCVTPVSVGWVAGSGLAEPQAKMLPSDFNASA